MNARKQARRITSGDRIIVLGTPATVTGVRTPDNSKDNIFMNIEMDNGSPLDWQSLMPDSEVELAD